MASNEQHIWNYLKSKGLNDCGVAGLMGNLYAESGLSPVNLQQTYERKLGYTDTSYTDAVDHGIYDNFVRDSAGYGIAQWTYWSRKQALLAFAKNHGASIGDLNMQLDFLVKEMSESYPSVWRTLHYAKSVMEASNAVLLGYERPADQSEAVQKKRAGYGQGYFDKYANEQSDSFDVDAFARLFAEMRKKLQDNDCSEYSSEARQWATGCGLITGNGTFIDGEPNYMWADMVTREQLATVLYRFAQL